MVMFSFFQFSLSFIIFEKQKLDRKNEGYMYKYIHKYIKWVSIYHACMHSVSSMASHIDRYIYIGVQSERMFLSYKPATYTYNLMYSLYVVYGFYSKSLLFHTLSDQLARLNYISTFFFYLFIQYNNKNNTLTRIANSRVVELRETWNWKCNKHLVNVSLLKFFFFLFYFAIESDC